MKKDTSAMPPSAKKPAAKKPQGFQKGREKTGGAKKGCKHKKTLYQETLAKLEDQQKAREALVAKTINGMDYDKYGNVLGPDYGQTPMEFMLNLMRDRRAPTAFRASAAKDVAKYVHPALAAIEVKQKSVNTNINTQSKDIKSLSTDDVSKLYRELLDND